MTKRFQALLAAVATLSLGCATLLSFASAGLVRSSTFGFDPLDLAKALLATAMFAGPIYLLFVIALPRPAWVGWRLVLASVLATHAIVHVALGIEDAKFRDAVGDCEGVRHHHTRAAPFESSGIGCHDGKFTAHD